MSTETSTALAQETSSGLTEPEGQSIAQQLEQQALEKVKQRQGVITDVAEEQKRALHRLFSSAGDGASLMQNSPMIKQIEEEVDDQAEERERRFTDGGKGIHIAELGEASGMFDDDTRKISVSTEMASVGSDRAVVEEVDAHEHRHAKQKESDEETSSLKTGNAQIDALLSVKGTAYREEDAMHAAGDRNTSRDYVEDYKKPVNRVAEFLNAHGEDGSEFVREAGLNGQVQQVRQKIFEVHMRKSLELRQK